MTSHSNGNMFRQPADGKAGQADGNAGDGMDYGDGSYGPLHSNGGEYV